MKKNTEIDIEIYELWNTKKYSFKEISQMKFKSRLSKKRIRNIIYSLMHSRSSLRGIASHSKKIYRLFISKYIETENVKRAIDHVFKNQPHFTVSERTVRYIINKQLLKNKKI